MLNLLDPSRKANNRKEEAINIKVFKHSLNWVAINTEGDTGHTEIQTAAYNIIGSQCMCTGRSHLAGHSTWTVEQVVKRLYWLQEIVNLLLKNLRKSYLTTDAVHQSHMSRGHLPHHYHPSLLLLQDRGYNLQSKPSLPADDSPVLSQRLPHGLPSPHSTTSYTVLTPHMYPRRCWALHWVQRRKYISINFYRQQGEITKN